MRHPLLLTLVIATAGCAVQRQPVPAEAEEAPANPVFITPDIYANKELGMNREGDLVRNGRYTLKSTTPTIAQEDLMAQIIEVTIPGSLKPTVGDALKHALSRSGYALTAPNNTTKVLFSRPLPAAHYNLGPMKLRDTLQVLAGPAWKVQVDEVTRQVAFSLRPGYQVPAQQRPRSPAAVAGTPVVSPPKAVIISTAPPSTSVTATASADHLDVEVAKSGSTGATPIPASSATAAIVSVPPPAPASKPPTQIWSAESGSTLRDSVEAWAEKAGWTLIWEQDDLNYPIVAPLRFEGSFQEAIDQVFPLYDKAPRSFVVDGSSSQRFVHIAERKKK
ncbi:hypothetical protein BVH03_17705 [Pseudomonas sp. PA15(2017)]|uniref:PFGI-1 class ICE element type IV pilus protein PilL2 n=1 Tax=Pseudomonas sp. PA15(2017) TaxID=1932111 RepID=UPI00096823DD|nr:TcpQ domain-containing protein [Pseudomonas sp. PA15(2017)]OLU25489.1 hypothetical protein BVH03_17705 [Pseudomonas sp. PA15(2017)]